MDRYLNSLFWDDRAKDLESQARAPLINPVEHALADEAAVRRIVRDIPEYAEGFRRSLGVEPDSITLHHVARSLATFERTLRAGGSRFDRYEYAGDKNALNAAEVRGLQLFRGRAQFKTPSLPNVALTAPYMHDGSVQTLAHAVELELYGHSRTVRYPIVLTLAEKADLIDFLKSLTSEKLDF